MLNFKHLLMCLPEVRLKCFPFYNTNSPAPLMRTYNLKMQDLLFYYENKKKNPHVEIISSTVDTGKPENISFKCHQSI